MSPVQPDVEEVEEAARRFAGPQDEGAERRTQCHRQPSFSRVKSRLPTQTLRNKCAQNIGHYLAYFSFHTIFFVQKKKLPVFTTSSNHFPATWLKVTQVVVLMMSDWVTPDSALYKSDMHPA